MKTRVTGRNPDQSPHVCYTPEGGSNRLLEELWNLHETEGLKYPISLSLGSSIVYIENRRDYGNFLVGLQVGFDMNRVF